MLKVINGESSQGVPLKNDYTLSHGKIFEGFEEPDVIKEVIEKIKIKEVSKPFIIPTIVKVTETTEVINEIEKFKNRFFFVPVVHEKIKEIKVEKLKNRFFFVPVVHEKIRTEIKIINSIDPIEPVIERVIEYIPAQGKMSGLELLTIIFGSLMIFLGILELVKG